MERRKGRPLGPGSLIAVTTPASPLLDEEYLHSGLGWLEAHGFSIRLGEHANVGESFKAGPVEVRARDLESAFADPEVDAIVPLAGGHAGAQILPHLDYELIAANPKPFVAFSELTVLHCALGERAGLVTFYGHMVSALTLVSDRTQHEWLRALTSTDPLGVIDPEGPPARTLVRGVAEGMLVGGTLSLVASLLGTPWELDTRGRILLLEDVDEEPPRIDRYLTQLLNAGKLQDAAGIWLGDYLRCRPREQMAAVRRKESQRRGAVRGADHAARNPSDPRPAHRPCEGRRDGATRRAGTAGRGSGAGRAVRGGAGLIRGGCR